MTQFEAEKILLLFDVKKKITHATINIQKKLFCMKKTLKN